MAEHDDELDRRITAVLGLAQQDAPDPQSAALPHPPRGARWLAVAAAVALVGGGVAVLAMHDEPESVVPAESTALTTLASHGSQLATSSSAATSSTIPAPRACSAPAVDSYDFFGSMHTVVQSAQALEISIEALDAPWCPGEVGVVRLTVTNVGAGQEQLDPVLLILNGGMPKYQLTHRSDESEPDVLSLAPGTGITVEYHVTLPAVPPGSYSLQVYGFGPGTDVQVAGPPACDTVDLAAVAGVSDGAGGHEMTPITVTNTGDATCFLGKPVVVMASAADGTTTASPIPFEEGGFFPVIDPRPSRVLAPGESTLVVLTTENSCLEPATSPMYWSQVQLWTGPQGNSNVVVDLGPDNRVQTECGLAISGWATP